MKSNGAVAMGFAFLAIVVAIVIGARLSDQAIAVLAGAVCGVGLAAPLMTALGVYIGSTRSKRPSNDTAPPAQVVVIPAPTQPTVGTPTYPSTAGPFAPAPRVFTIIGDDEPEDGSQ